MTLRGGVVVGLVLLVAGLVVYKSAGAVRQLEYARANGSPALKADVVSNDSPFAPVRLVAQSANYPAAIAVQIALPTFEIPLAVTLLAAGTPLGAAAALLFAGPAVNLASLLTVGREAGWKAVWIVAAMVWLIAVAGGLAVG